MVLEQCSQTIRDHITASPSWTVLKANTNDMGLLRLIQQSLFTGTTAKKDTEALQDAELSLYTFHQGETMTNSIYLEKYKGLIECYKHHGGQPGLQEIQVQAKFDTLAADPAAPTDVETAQAREAPREEYLAVLLIRLSNPKQYSTLIVNLQNNHTCGTNQYPTTIAKAYDMLVHY